VDVRSLGYRTDLMVRALEGSQIEDRGDYLVVRSPHNPTFWWGNFLLAPAPPPPGQAWDWLDRFTAEFPAARHVALGVDVTEAGEVGAAGLLAAGLRLTSLAVLTASAVHPPPRPSTRATCRLLTGDADWQQAAELRAAASGGGPGGEPGFMQGRLATQRAMTEAGHGWWFGAFTEGRLRAQLGVIVGDDGLARYQHVETHPAARRQGLAGTLVWHAGQYAAASGRVHTLVVVADPGDSAISVYRSTGFATAQAQLSFDRQPPAPG
jgi:GNAT superfamily N-acetyltransferase